MPAKSRTALAAALLNVALASSSAAQTAPPTGAMPGMPGMSGMVGGAPPTAADGPGAAPGRVIMLLGHLSVSDELVRAGRTDEAVRHYEHMEGAMSATYGPWLATLGDPGFADGARRLLAAGRSRNAEGALAASAGMRAGLARALDAVRIAARDPDAVTLRGVAYAVKATAPEYGASLQGRRIVGTTDWEDGRGYLAAAEAEFDAVAPRLATRPGAAGAVARMRAALAALHATWPTAVPPAEAVTPPDALQGDVDLFAAEAATVR